MDPISTLQSIGLTEKEARTYLVLTQEGESKTGRLCQKTKIPSSHIYLVLNQLLEKGLIHYKLVNNIRIYRVAEPDALSQLFEEKEKNIREEKTALFQLVTNLKKTPQSANRLSDFKYYTGIRGIRSLYTELIQNWKKGQELCIASSVESFKTLESFFMNTMHRQRIKDQVKFRILINVNCRRYGEKRSRLALSRVRYLNLKTKTEFGTVGGYFFLTAYGNEPYGLLIKDPTFAEDYKAFFEYLWSQARP